MFSTNISKVKMTIQYLAFASIDQLISVKSQKIKFFDTPLVDLWKQNLNVERYIFNVSRL